MFYISATVSNSWRIHGGSVLHVANGLPLSSVFEGRGFLIPDRRWFVSKLLAEYDLSLPPADGRDRTLDAGDPIYIGIALNVNCA